VALKDYIFTSESVSEGHPDKVCDQISDAILDAFIANDIKLGIADDSHANTRLGCETLATTNKIVIAGEGRASDPYMKKYGKQTIVNREALTKIAREVVEDIGYDQDGFSFHGADVEVLLHGQSPDIAMGVDAKKKGGNLGEQEGAGDQGLMFGFACRDSEEYEKNSFMPAPIYFSHKILEVLSKARRSGELGDLQPDAKSQVTVRYLDGKAVGATKVVVSTQHREANAKGKKYNSGLIKEMIAAHVEKSLPKGWMPRKASDFFVNPTGNFVVGGPDGDCGLTGRKIIVDTYGGYAPHGGGAFSGKDPTKVDRSAAYAARYLAKNIVAAGVAERCTIQIAYAIGVADPMSLLVDTHGTSKVDEKKLEKVLPQIFRLTPTNIRRALKLCRPIYRRTAAYGHFGRAPDKDGGFSWEKTDLVKDIRSAVG
jgi:S-adenosylmethionine synthetase